jgi:hypothetical protein
MQADHTITPGLVDNRDRFKSPFYDRFKLRTAPKPLQLTDDIAKDFLFPTLYRNVSCAIGIFMCDYDRAKAALPHPTMHPVRMPGGRAVVIFSCYEYREVLGMRPYNEIAMTIPVMMGSGSGIPVLPLVLKAFKNFGYHVFSMPVTSLENQIRGTRIWGIPKVVEQIEVTVDDTHSTTVAFDDAGREYFRLSIPTKGTKQHFDETGHLYSVLNGKVLKAQTNFKGDFQVNKQMDLLWNKGKKTERPLLTLGDSPRSEVLKSLNLEECAFQTRYCPGMEACFDLPMNSDK